MKKYEFTGETRVISSGITLKRIRSLISFYNGTLHIKEGDVGGWIEKESNLSHNDNAWVYGNAQVCDNAWVYDNAHVYGDALVYGNALVYGDAQVCGGARVSDNAKVRYISDILTIGNIGSRGDTTTFYKTKDNDIWVICGCFSGYIKDFIKKVHETHKGNKHEKIYLIAAGTAMISIKEMSFEEIDNILKEACE